MNRGKDIDFNEFYTTYDQCELYFSHLKKTGQLDNIKSICCPCDGANSNIVKWLKANTKAKIVYFDYLDCNSQKARQQMLKCGCVITNPPFESKHWTPLFEFLRGAKLKYLIFGTFLQTGHLRHIKDFDCVYQSPYKEAYDFIRPDGTLSAVHIFLYTNFNYPEDTYEYKPVEKVQYYRGIPVFDKVANVPKDYNDWFYAPLNILCFIRNRDYSYERTLATVPGKYVRVCIRRKH